MFGQVSVLSLLRLALFLHAELLVDGGEGGVGGLSVVQEGGGTAGFVVAARHSFHLHLIWLGLVASLYGIYDALRRVVDCVANGGAGQSLRLGQFAVIGVLVLDVETLSEFRPVGLVDRIQKGFRWF